MDQDIRVELPTDEEIQSSIEESMINIPEDELEALLAVDDAIDKYMCLKLSRELGIKVETIPGDRHHISVDGTVMGYVEFAEYLQARADAENDAEENDAEDYVDFLA